MIPQENASTNSKVTVTAFNQVLVDADHRTLNATAKFSDADQLYGKVTMRLKLECPNERCDYWDRAGYVAVLEDGKQIELMRFMTPYRLPGEWDLDVTSLQPLLKGDIQFELFIDTWVKKGHPQGDGWLATVSFDFEGSPDPEQPVPIQVIPLWNEQKLVVGDPNQPINGKITPVSVSIPANASRVELRSLITGHGQGNTCYRNPQVSEEEQEYHSSGCAEWCSLEHTYSVGEIKFSKVIWRDDCDTTVGPARFGNQEQMGTWRGHRAGWCPGDIVIPWVEDVPVSKEAENPGATVQPGVTVQVKYNIEHYINYENSGYDKDGHTEPFYRISALLVIYS